MTEKRCNLKNSRIDVNFILKKLSQYQHPSNLKSIWQLVNSVIPYAALWYGAYYFWDYSFGASLPFIVLASGFLIRIFIIFHDCGHQTFFKSKKANNFWGRITGLLTFTPYYVWSSEHAKHHAHSGNLDKRGHGDIWMMTVTEYLSSSKTNRFRYRFYRNPLVMFLLGPLHLTLVSNRFISLKANKKEKLSIYITNFFLLITVVAVSFLMGAKMFLVTQLIILFLSHVVGVWLFYIQHQFEGMYWARNKEWDFYNASISGGSYYKLPAIFQWFTGNIGYHHVHHLNSRIPNYNLPKCQKQIEVFETVKPVRLLTSLKSLKYRLWDENSGQLVSYKEIRRYKKTG